MRFLRRRPRSRAARAGVSAEAQTPRTEISWLPDERREHLIGFIDELERYCRGDRRVVSDQLALTLAMYDDDVDALGRELVEQLADVDAGRPPAGGSLAWSVTTPHDRRRGARPPA
jgi:hypothetical protein